jgi:hypothetical protein
LADFGLNQHITEPTHPASGKTLDLAITSNPCTFIKSTVASGMSDHSLVLFDVNARQTRTKKPPHKVFLYKKANTQGMNDDLLKAQSTYFQKCNHNSVQQNWEFIKSSITQAMQDHIPSKMTSRKTSLPVSETPDEKKRPSLQKGKIHHQAK